MLYPPSASEKPLLIIFFQVLQPLGRVFEDNLCAVKMLGMELSARPLKH
jgi:hypothetical protein